MEIFLLIVFDYRELNCMLSDYFKNHGWFTLQESSFPNRLRHRIIPVFNAKCRPFQLSKDPTITQVPLTQSKYEVNGRRRRSNMVCKFKGTQESPQV